MKTLPISLSLRELLEVIGAFAAAHPELLDEEVALEGCDCVDNCAGIRLSKRHGVLLLRTDGGVTEYEDD